MPTFLDTLLALNGVNLPPLPAPAAGMPLMPAPASPISVGPAFGASPELMASDVAPRAPLPALDTNFINQYAGAPPTPPVVQQPNFLDKLAGVLSGIAQGPQYGAYLREQRERPQREYQAQLERYQGRKAQGLELATRAQERQQAATQKAADEQSDREFKAWLRAANITDEQAIMQARQAFDLQKIREQEPIRLQEQDAKQKAMDERQARTIEYNLASGADAAPPAIAKEMAQYIMNGTPLSPTAQKWRNGQVQKIAAQIAKLTR